MPKNKRSKCDVDDEEATFYFDNSQWQATTKHDLNILFPVLNINPGIRNYQSFHEAFCSLINDDGLDLEEELISIDNNDYLENDGVVLRLIGTETHLNKHVDAAELTSKTST